MSNPYCIYCRRIGADDWAMDTRGGTNWFHKSCKPSEPTGVTVTVSQYPAGALMRIRCQSGGIDLDRDEAFELYNQMAAKLGEMPAKL